MVGILGPGCEFFTPREYKILVECIRSQFQVPDSALEFFLDHINHDEGHIELFNEALGLVAGNEKELKEIIDGARSSIEIEIRFWQDMHSVCCGVV